MIFYFFKFFQFVITVYFMNFYIYFVDFILELSKILIYMNLKNKIIENKKFFFSILPVSIFGDVNSSRKTCRLCATR